MGNEIYKVTIFRNPLLKDEIVFIADSRKIYEITFDNGKKDLIKILSSDLYINVKSILKGGYKLKRVWVKDGDIDIAHWHGKRFVSRGGIVHEDDVVGWADIPRPYFMEEV